MKTFLIELGKTVLVEDGESLIRYRRIGRYKTLTAAIKAFNILMENNKDTHNLALWFHTPSQTQMIACSRKWR